MSVARSGLITRVCDFSEALLLELGILLDHNDDVAGLDWRELIAKLELGGNYDNISKHVKKTEAILRIWSYKNPQNSNGRELVKILVDLGRRDAVSAIEYHLGEEFDPSTNEKEDLFMVLDRAAKLGNVQMLTEHLGSSIGEDVERQYARKPYSLLHSAAMYGHLPAVQYLVHKGFFVNRRNHEGKTPREVSQQLGHEQVSKYLEEIEQRGEVNGRSVMSTEGLKRFDVERSELDRLTYEGDVKGMRQLLQQGHDANDGGEQDWVPLHTAIDRDNLEAVKVLVEFNADLRKKNAKLYTPEVWARLNGRDHIADYLKVVQKSRLALEEANTLASSPSPQPEQRGNDPVVITVHQRDPDCSIEEYMVEDRTLDQVCKGISKQLEVPVTVLVDKATNQRINDVGELQHGQDVVALAEEEKHEQGKKHNVDEEVCSTIAQLFSKLWCSAPVELRYFKHEHFEAILQRASKLFLLTETEISELYLPSTLAEITTTEELAKHRRVIAATKHDDIQKATSKLALQSMARPVSVTVDSIGGHLFEAKTGVYISIPEYAVKHNETVTIKLTVYEPNIRMDFGGDDLRFISDPILIETIPPGYSFLKPVQVRLPHCGVTKRKEGGLVGETVRLYTAPSSSDDRSSIQFERVTAVDFSADQRYLRFGMYRFSWFYALIYNALTWGECVASVHYPATLRADCSQFQIRLLCYPNLHVYAVGAQQHIGERPDYERRKQVYSLGYGNRTDVSVRATNSSWTITPMNMAIPFENLWRKMMPLSCMTAIPAERTFTVTWQGQLPPNQSLDMTFTVAGETTVELQILINFPGFVHPGIGGFILPASAENSLAHLLNQHVPNSRDYRGVAGELGFTMQQVDEMTAAWNPTRALLAACRNADISIIDFIEAAEHLERQDVVDLLKNVNVGL